MSGFAYLCPLCATVRHENKRAVCAQCVSEGNNLRRLYLRIVLARPHLQGLSIDQVVSKMYERLLQLEEREEGSGERGAGRGKRRGRRR